MTRIPWVIVAVGFVWGGALWVFGQEDKKEEKPGAERIEIRGGHMEVQQVGGQGVVVVDGRHVHVGGPNAPTRSSRLMRSSRMNAVDSAYFDIADLLVQKGENEEAIETLKQITSATPDADAASAAHLSMGNILREQIGDTAAAVAEYKLVTGRYAELARRQIVAAYQEVGEIDKAVGILEEMLARTDASADKVRVLNEIAEVYKKSNNIDKAIETLRKIPKVITYEEAMKAQPGYHPRVGITAFAPGDPRKPDDRREVPIKPKEAKQP